MKLTSREKTLLGLLIVALLFYVEYTYLLSGQMERIKAATEVKSGLELRLDQLKNAEKTTTELDTQIDQGMGSLSGVMDKYFVSTQQEEIILLVNDLLAGSGIDASGFTFGVPEEVMLEDKPFRKMNLTMNITANYPDLEKFYKKVWDFKKMIVIDNVSLARNEQGSLGGNIDLGFYYLSGYEGVGYKDNLYQIMPDDSFLKSDPYTPSAGAGDFRINYLYTAGKEPGDVAYTPFSDITGHWSENLVNSFGEQGYLPQTQTNTFGPDTPMSRGEFVIMLDRIYKWPMPDQPVNLQQFTDYASLGSYENSIAKAVYKGYLGGFVVGYSDNTLRPRDAMTYEEMEFIVQKLKNQPDFKWDSVAAALKTEKNVDSKGVADKKTAITKAETVYLMSVVK